MKTWPPPKVEAPQQEQRVVSHDPEAAVEVGGGGPTEAGWHSMADGIGCPKEGQYKHVRGIGTPMLQTPDHFAVGGLLHAGRATWFGSKFATDAKTITACRDEILKAADSFKLPVSETAKANAIRYFNE